MSYETSEIEAAALRREHSTLDSEIAEWRQWWEQLSELGQPHFGEMGDRLAHFRERLANHFAHEESQGCLSLTIKLPQAEVNRIAELRDEHSQLLSDLDQLISRLQQCEPEIDCWGKAREEFETYLDRLKDHENTEEVFLSKLT